MAKLWTSGPVLVFTGTSLSKQPEYLGTGEEAPDVEISRSFEEVKNDLAGTVLPMDRVYEGQEGMTSVVLNRYNERVLLHCQSIRPGLADNASPGIDEVDNIGTMIGQEGWTYPLWLLFPYATLKPSMADMKPGYRFWSSFLIGPDQIKAGTRAKRVHLMFKHQRAFTAASSPVGTVSAVGGAPNIASLINLKGKLYDFDMSNVANIAID